MKLIEQLDEIKKLCDADALISLNNAILIYNDSLKKFEQYKSMPTLYNNATARAEKQLMQHINFIASINTKVKDYINKQIERENKNARIFRYF